MVGARSDLHTTDHPSLWGETIGQTPKEAHVETKKFELGEVVSGKDVNTQGWRAWLNTMPPGPSILHVRGEALVGNPGIGAMHWKSF